MLNLGVLTVLSLNLSHFANFIEIVIGGDSVTVTIDVFFS